jgi:hypothetical protein
MKVLTTALPSPYTTFMRVQFIRDIKVLFKWCQPEPHEATSSIPPAHGTRRRTAPVGRTASSRRDRDSAHERHGHRAEEVVMQPRSLSGLLHDAQQHVARRQHRGSGSGASLRCIATLESLEEFLAVPFNRESLRV